MSPKNIDLVGFTNPDVINGKSGSEFRFILFRQHKQINRAVDVDRHCNPYPFSFRLRKKQWKKAKHARYEKPITQYIYRGQTDELLELRDKI